MRQEIKERKETLLTWLKEEAYFPEEKSDPHACFNIAIKVGNMPFHVVQKVQNIDSIFVTCRLVLTESQKKSLMNLDEQKRETFFWDVKLALLRNIELGDFEIQPNTEKVEAFFISSKRIFYDALTKDRLMSAILNTFKSMMTVIWTLQRYSGLPPPK